MKRYSKRMNRFPNNSSNDPKNIISDSKHGTSKEGNISIERNSYEFVKGKLEEYNKLFEDVKAKLEEYNNQSELVKAKFEEYSKQFDSVKAKLEEYSKQFESVKEKIEEYSKKLEFVKAKLEEYKEKIRIIENSKNTDRNKPTLYKKVIPTKINNNNNIEKAELKEIKPKGIVNIRGSCYLDSCLQCLIHIKPLTIYFCDNNNNIENNNLCKEYKSIISKYMYKSNTLINPYNFKRELIKINPDYNKFGNDPKDFMIDFMFYINKELLGDEQSFILKNEINKTNKIKLFQFYREEFQRSQTIITELFGWFKQIEKNCLFCKQKTYEFIIDTNFIFNLQKICEDMKNRNLRLIDCFKNYFSEEIKKFTCKNCRNINKNGKVSNKICMLPNYLIIILDRGKDDEFNCNIDFGYKIDLNDVTEQIEDKSNTNYNLIAATFLYGTSGAGHTVAFCKHFDGQYYIFDDTNYYIEELKNLKKNKPFIIIYEKEL